MKTTRRPKSEEKKNANSSFRLAVIAAAFPIAGAIRSIAVDNCDKEDRAPT